MNEPKVIKLAVGLEYPLDVIGFWGWNVKGQDHRAKSVFFKLTVHNKETNHPKMFKPGTGNDLGISYKFGVIRSKVKVSKCIFPHTLMTIRPILSALDWQQQYNV